MILISPQENLPCHANHHEGYAFSHALPKPSVLRIQMTVETPLSKAESALYQTGQNANPTQTQTHQSAPPHLSTRMIFINLPPLGGQWHPLFALLLELGLANVAAAQLDVEDALHGRQHLLVRGGGAALKVGDDGGRRVALGGQVLLRHLGLHLLTRRRDDVADLLADRLGLDDVVGPVDLGQVLALDGGSRGLLL